jgi:hypothetical protein
MLPYSLGFATCKTRQMKVCRPHTSIDKQTSANGFSNVTVPAQIVGSVDRQTAYVFHFCRER